MEKLNKRHFIILLTILLCFAVAVGLNEIKSFDGYYRSIDKVMVHEKAVQRGAENIARIQNGSGYIEILRFEDTLIFYNFKSKNTLFGRKYAVAMKATKRIDYQNLDNMYNDFQEWNVFSTTIFNNLDEKDLYWCIIEKNDELIIQRLLQRMDDVESSIKDIQFELKKYRYKRSLINNNECTYIKKLT